MIHQRQSQMQLLLQVVQRLGLAVEAKAKLAQDGIDVRVVSIQAWIYLMPASRI